MKNAQNEYEKPAESLLSSITTAATTAAATTTTTTVVQHLPSPSVSPSSPIEISKEIVENAHKNNPTAATAAAHATKMTDERNNEKNNDSNSGNNVNNNGNLIAEAAKILLKNGLNGTSAAAAALLTAAKTFQLPTIPLPINTSETTATSTLLSRNAIDCVVNQSDPPPAHVASSSKLTTMSSAVAVGHLSQRNNGLPSSNSLFKTTTKDMCLTTSSGLGASIKSMSTGSGDAGVIDYTLGTTSNGTQKTLSTTSTVTSSSVSGGYAPSSGGGRLQFFKDGKFILELARSKDGERGGWVSVPRKHFRQPSATTSTVTPASTTNACAYPKIESSTSLSFSDDNSSIQSSPWQRDHCWKQTAPKRNISKEMSVYFILPKNITLTNAGLRLAKHKRRRPYDDSTNHVKGLKLFEQCITKSDRKKSISNDDEKMDPTPYHRLQNGSSNSTVKSEEEDRCSTSSVATLVGENDSIDAEKITENVEEACLGQEKIIKTESSIAVDNADEVTDTTVESKEEKTNSSFVKEKVSIKNETEGTNLEVEKMNTSEDTDEKMSMAPKESQPIEETSTLSVRTVTSNTADVDDAPTPVQSKKGVEEKRLNKRKERAKLTSIVQKLTDCMTARASTLAKVPLSNNSSGAQNINFLSNKVSPTSSSSTSPSLLSTSSASATASRLVDYHHQQHVSPRKRILREFEKVSLEDTSATCGAGGKRSRAKSSASSSISTHYRNTRSPNNRGQSNVCSVPTVSVGSSSISTTSSNGESLKNINATPAGSKHTKNFAATNAQPTRLYSSYSIHSLLGDQSSSSSSSSGSSSSSAASKKPCEQPAFVSNMAYHQHNQHQQSTEQSLYVRKSVSPKSPDAGGGKSPSSNAANKKRSPPYSSPMHESLSRSPSVSNSIDYSPRATPPEFILTSKQRYGSNSTTEQQQNLLQHHRHLQQGAFYSPYMMSPKYVPGSVNIVTGSTSPPSTSRSPRHSTAAFTSPTTSTTISTANQQNIPNSYSSHLAPPPQRELSPSHSTADFPRESTPRTVPKKTASIRRQFASPTASSHNTPNSSTSCPSPSERSSEEITSNCKTSSSLTSAAYQEMLQRSSPSSALPSPLHPAAYYMYPPVAPLFGSSNSSSNLSASGSSPIAHAAQTSAYIPSCYHSYLSALNITKHFYMGAGASQSAAARLSSPFHSMSIPYNGVNAAAVAAAAAAAAATAAFSGQPHMGHHPMLPPPSAAQAFYGIGSGFGVGLNPTTTSTSAVSQTQKSTESNLVAMNADISSETTMSTGGTSSASARSAQFSSTIKDEHSSDVPLNLSKH